MDKGTGLPLCGHGGVITHAPCQLSSAAACNPSPTALVVTLIDSQVPWGDLCRLVPQFGIVT